MTARKWSNGDWKLVPHLDLISDKVAELAEKPLRLIVSMPPRHGKSELLSHWTPVWFLSNWPWKNVGLASYAADFAGTWGRKARDSVVENQVRLGLRVRDDLNRASQWQLSAGGGMMTAGVGGPFTGYGFDLLILDDPIKNRQEADSITMRNHLWEWWRSTARTRLEPGGSVIIVATRWHEDDLIGRLLSDEFLEGEEASDRWEHIRLPSLAEPGDPLGREEDAPLWPERYDATALAAARVDIGPQEWPGLYDATALAAARVDIGPQEWPGLYQQRPSRQGGSVFRDHWWGFEEKVEPGDRVFQFWDTAFKTGQQNDYSVCCTMTTTPNGYAVLDVWRNRVEYPDLLRAMQAQAKEHNPSAIFVEDAASGQSVVQSLRRETRLPVLPIKPVGDKVLRANRVTGTVEAKKITLPSTAPWLQAFREELASFPNGVHDDQVDAFVGCLTQLMQRAGRVSIAAPILVEMRD